LRLAFRTHHLQRCAEHAAEAFRAWGTVVGDRYLRRIVAIKDAATVQDLYDLRSLRLHPLRGGQSGRHAIVLTGSWRLIVTIQGDTVTIEEVSNHYDD
jgi:plasmid maintenance system killer protein